MRPQSRYHVLFSAFLCRTDKADYLMVCTLCSSLCSLVFCLLFIARTLIYIHFYYVITHIIRVTVKPFAPYYVLVKLIISGKFGTFNHIGHIELNFFQFCFVLCFYRYSSKLGKQIAELHLYNQSLRDKLRKEENTVGRV